jgi:hypothetical protein
MTTAPTTEHLADTFPAGMTVTIYARPNGRASEHFITNVDREDADWFRSNNVAVSLEDCGQFFAAYADCGLTEDDGETPREITVTGSQSDGCNALLSKLRSATFAAAFATPA